MTSVSQITNWLDAYLSGGPASIAPVDLADVVSSTRSAWER